MTSQTHANHILVPIQTLVGGGVERVALRLAGEWLALGRRVTLVLGSDAGPLAAELPAGVEIVHVGDGRYTAVLRAMPRTIRTAAPDVIFCAGNHYSSMGAYARWRLGAACPPIVAKVSNALVRRDQGRVHAAGYRAWLRLHPRFLDAVVAMTPGMRTEAIAEMAMSPERVHVIANPAPRIAVGTVSPGTGLVGVGRLAPQKRWDRAIAALARLSDPTVTLTIFGEGEERATLTAQAAALGLGDRVRLPGYTPDPSAAIAGAGAVVLTSDFEGVPGVLREAIAAGTPVITTDSSVAVREILTSPAQGSVVAVDDADALVAAIAYWLEPGRARPTPQPVPNTSAADYVALFDSLVAATATAPPPPTSPAPSSSV
jgi:glycosyltransferase involved in cell wall biosynthesis